jgi:hypothetical protein
VPSSFRPRISQAKDLFPIVRTHLAAAAALHSLPAGFSLDLLPIVEEGIAGYEVLPSRASYTFLTIGWDERGKPVLRESTYLDGPPGGLRVVSIDGQAQPVDCGAPQRLRQRDSVLPDWPTAAEAVWSELARLDPQEPRYAIEVHDLRLEELDEALATAYRHLADFDPDIDFCGVPDEAQYGFALSDAKGGRGQLIARHPETWTLWFQSATGTIHEEWAMLPGSGNAIEGWVRASGTPVSAPSGVVVSALAAASQRSWRRERGGDRRHGERRRADRAHEERPYEDRREGERRQSDRRQSRLGTTTVQN